MHIAICEDETAQAKLLERMVQTWAAHTQTPLTLRRFPSAEQFLFSWSDSPCWDILLLDIQMDTMSGMELAQRIRKSDKRLAIVFITGLSDYVFEGYEVGALNYLVKPVEQNKLFQCLDRAKTLLENRDEKSLMIQVDGQTVRIKQRELHLLEARSHYVRMVTADTEYMVKMPLAALEAELDPSRFCRCHRSYIVNLAHVDRITRSDAILQSGEAVPISRNQWADFNRAFIRHHTGEGL